MKRFFIMSLCALALFACTKPVTDPQNPSTEPEGPVVQEKPWLSKIEEYRRDEVLEEYTYLYDDYGRLIQVLDKVLIAEPVFVRTYDLTYGENQIISKTDKFESVATLDGQGRVQTIKYAVTGETPTYISISYDQNGNMTQNVFDNSDRISSFEWKDGNMVHNEYNNGQLDSEADFKYTAQPLECNINMPYIYEIFSHYIPKSRDAFTMFGLVKALGNTCKKLPSRIEFSSPEEYDYQSLDFTYQIEDGLITRIDYKASYYYDGFESFETSTPADTTTGHFILSYEK